MSVYPSVLPISEADSGCILKAVSYNVHRCIGMDGLYNPDRIAAVLQAIDFDVIGLQEVDTRLPAGAGMMQLDYLATKLKTRAFAGPCIQEDHGYYGNALLTRLPVIDFRLIDLSLPGREPRGALDVDIRMQHHILRIIVTHLGCRAYERRYQIRCLLNHIGKERHRPTVIIGDFNEWFPLSWGVRKINSHFGLTSAKASFPACFPVLPLDRIWVKNASHPPRFHVVKTALTKTASDHLPVQATIRI